ncbi:MAG: collagen type III alpha, partial [Mariniblastus sp.]
MASQVKTPARSANAQQTSASVRQAQKVKDYVNVELEKTRKQVKIVDLIASVLLMLASVVGVLLLLVIVDAWIWPLSTSARWAGLILIVGGCLAYSAIAILPLLLKQINPDYAAKMIEEAKPSFRNSLINYVSFRKRPDEIKPAVFDAVSRQAAADLASVPGDATVDQSKLIRLGFVLIGLTVFAVGYKMLSPKDPLQTLARVVAPAAQIAKPAVVRIEDVQPGDTAVFFGEQLVVTATVRGQHRPEDVRLVYSTLDGQLSDQTVSMKPTSSPSQYETKLSMAGGGIQSSLQYRVEALDGQSP